MPDVNSMTETEAAHLEESSQAPGRTRGAAAPCAPPPCPAAPVAEARRTSSAADASAASACPPCPPPSAASSCRGGWSSPHGRHAPVDLAPCTPGQPVLMKRALAIKSNGDQVFTLRQTPPEHPVKSNGDQVLTLRQTPPEHPVNWSQVTHRRRTASRRARAAR